MPIPLAYFVTVTTYGTWLQGDARGSVDMDHNEFATEVIRPNPLLLHVKRRQMKFEPFRLSPKMIRIVDAALAELCEYRKWDLLARNVRTNHLHAAIFAPAIAERVLGDIKRWPTRKLREAGLAARDRPVWTDGGSTKYLWDQASLTRVLDYIDKHQGPDLREQRTF